VAQAADQLPGLLKRLQTELGLTASELTQKVSTLHAQISALRAEFEEIAPWTQSLVPRQGDSITDNSTNDRVSPPIAGSQFQVDWKRLLEALNKPLSLNQLSAMSDDLAPLLGELQESLQERGLPPEESEKGRAWLETFAADLASGSAYATSYRDRLRRLGERYERMALNMDFTLLYNPQRRLFSVGYNLEDGRPDRSHYDLLASEARIASLISIAKGDADHRHWFQLGRALTRTTSGGKGLLSWGGTMFEFPRTKLPCGRPASNCVLQTATRSLGNFRKRVLRSGHQFRLSVPIVWRSRPRPQTGPGQGLGNIALFNGAGGNG
jgi:cyclic beta-1,2-glucan synthetase